MQLLHDPSSTTAQATVAVNRSCRGQPVRNVTRSKREADKFHTGLGWFGRLYGGNKPSRHRRISVLVLAALLWAGSSRMGGAKIQIRRPLTNKASSRVSTTYSVNLQLSEPTVRLEQAATMTCELSVVRPSKTPSGTFSHRCSIRDKVNNLIRP
jgi:hypothetical protein